MDSLEQLAAQIAEQSKLLASMQQTMKEMQTSFRETLAERDAEIERMNEIIRHFQRMLFG